MEKIDFTKTKTDQGDYAATVRECESNYNDKLSDKIFNLGQYISDKRNGSKFPLNAKEWTAWMRKMDYKENENYVVFGMPNKPSEWWIGQVFERFHKILAIHFNRPVYYAIDGKIIDLAKYDVKRYHDMNDQEKHEADEMWAEVKKNIKAFLGKGKERRIA